MPHQDPRVPHPDQAGPARPGPGRRPCLREWAHPAGPVPVTDPVPAHATSTSFVLPPPKARAARTQEGRVRPMPCPTLRGRETNSGLIVSNTAQDVGRLLVENPITNWLSEAHADEAPQSRWAAFSLVRADLRKREQTEPPACSASRGRRLKSCPPDRRNRRSEAVCLDDRHRANGHSWCACPYYPDSRCQPRLSCG